MGERLLTALADVGSSTGFPPLDTEIWGPIGVSWPSERIQLLDRGRGAAATEAEEGGGQQMLLPAWTTGWTELTETTVGATTGAA